LKRAPLSNATNVNKPYKPVVVSKPKSSLSPESRISDYDDYENDEPQENSWTQKNKYLVGNKSDTYFETHSQKTASLFKPKEQISVQKSVKDGLLENYLAKAQPNKKEDKKTDEKVLFHLKIK